MPQDRADFNQEDELARCVKIAPVCRSVADILETEIPLTGYLEALRDTILFGFVLAIVFALPTPKWSA